MILTQLDNKKPKLKKPKKDELIFVSTSEYTLNSETAQKLRKRMGLPEKKV